MKTQIVNVSLPERMLEAADEQAERELRSRSEFFREAVRWYLINNGIWAAPQRALKVSR